MAKLSICVVVLGWGVKSKGVGGGGGGAEGGSRGVWGAGRTNRHGTKQRTPSHLISPERSHGGLAEAKQR